MSKANRTYLASIKETEWGVTPADPVFKKINFTGESLNYDIKSKSPDTIRDDRMTSDVILTSAGNVGGYDFEVQAGAADDHLQAALWASSWVGVAGATTSGSAEGGVASAALSSIDLTAVALGSTMVVGQHFAIIGSTANNKIFRVTDKAGQVYTVTPAPADEAFSAAVEINSAYIRNGVTRNSFTIERGHSDVDQYFLFQGMTVDKYSMKIVTEAVVKADYEFVGKSAELTQAANGASYETQPTTPFMSAAFNVANILFDGVPAPACWVNTLELAFSNNLEGKTAVATFGYCNTSEGEFVLTGTLSAYFEDESLFDRFKNNTAFTLEFTMYDNEGNAYVYFLPRVKLSGEKMNATGKNTDVMDNATFSAIVDNTTAMMVQITKIAGYVPA